jgi:hypothetical protein
MRVVGSSNMVLLSIMKKVTYYYDKHMESMESNLTAKDIFQKN